MNTYDENLSSTVVASLQSMELEEKKINSELNASLFKLYYAEGATITATEKLDESKLELKHKNEVKTQAVDCSSLSENLLSSATQGDQYVKLSVTNTAVCAANIQVAANAIVKLAGDIGTAYSIVNAADRNSDIYKLTAEVRKLIIKTAYNAEVASQLAMEASMHTSEISSSTVLDVSKTENANMTNMLKIANSDFDTLSQTVTSDHTTLALASSVEKSAEGNLEDISVDHTATTLAYKKMNEYLNINLTAVPDKSNTNSTFEVKFRTLKSAFEKNKKEAHYPVESYYLIVVKERNKSVFSLTNAENALHQESYQCIPVKDESISKGGVAACSINIYEKDIFETSEVLDSDGDKISLGENYVVFVLGVYYDDYKRKINNFDDFLSAPSQSFCLTNELNKVKASEIKFHEFKLENLSEEEAAAYKSYKKSGGVDAEYQIKFNVEENIDFPVEYRCMLLVDSKAVTKGMLTENLLKALGNETTQLQRISDHYDPKIAELESERNNLVSMIEDFDPDTQSMEILNIQKETTELTAKITDLKNSRDLERNEKLGSAKKNRLGFVFNLTIAEQVSAGNYVVAYPVEKAGGTKGKSSSKKSDEDDGQDLQQTNEWIGFIGADATDNFGNKLVDATPYLPVVVSFSTANEANINQFTNAISSIEGAKSHIYNIK